MRSKLFYFKVKLQTIGGAQKTRLLSVPTAIIPFVSLPTTPTLSPCQPPFVPLTGAAYLRVLRLICAWCGLLLRVCGLFARGSNVRAFIVFIWVGHNFVRVHIFVPIGRL